MRPRQRRSVVAVHLDPRTHLLRVRLSCGHAYAIVLPDTPGLRERLMQANARSEFVSCKRCQRAIPASPRSRGTV